MTGILIAEDEERIASFVAKGLRAAGFQPTVVTSGTDAYDFAMTGDFGLLLLDIGLPGLDGLEVMRRVRAAGSTTPVIILTARSAVEDVLASLEGGANVYLAKPFRFDELLARIRLRLNDAANSTCARGGRSWRGGRSTSRPASSRWRRSSCGTRARCSVASSC